MRSEQVQDWKTPQGFSKRIALCRKVGRWQEAAYLLQRMCVKNLDPNNVTCNMVISCLARQGRWQLAVSVLAGMPQMKVSPDLISYNSAISACEAAGEWENTLALLEALELDRLQPDVICYSGVISACAKGGFWRLTLMLLNRISAQRMQPDLVASNSALGAFKGPRWPMAISMLTSFSSLRLAPDVVSFCTAISCCADMWPQALQLLQLRSRHTRLALDVFGFSSAMSCMSAGQAWSSTLDLLTDMLSCQVEPNHFSCSSAISASPWQRAISILEVTASSHVCFVATLATCASALAWEAALGCLQNMLELQMDPGSVEVGTLAEALHRAKGRNAAWTLLRSMSQTAWKEDRSQDRSVSTAALQEGEILSRRHGILVANKPDGTSTEGYVADLGNRLGTTLTLTSRLDFPTSGALPLGIGAESLAGKWIQAQLAARLVDKEYVLLCQGAALGPVGTRGVVSAKLLTVELEGHTSRSEVSEEGREARTEYEVLQRFFVENEDELMLVAAHPVTGRTHQIRVHFAFLGRPLLGDLTYGRRSAVPCPRLFLHCRRFSCLDLEGSPLVAEAPLPSELQELLTQLRASQLER